MNQFTDLASAATALAAVGCMLHQRGWVPATGGNFSVRLDDNNVAITASGCHKGELVAADVLSCDLHGKLPSPARKPSYETPLHLALYRADASVGAVLHTHSVANTVLSRQHPRGVRLQGYELLKLLPGIDTHACQVVIPVFANDQDVVRLAQQVEAHRAAQPQMPPAYLIAGHGLYTWSTSLAHCRWQVEALEFMFQCELAAAQCHPPAEKNHE